MFAIGLVFVGNHGNHTLMVYMHGRHDPDLFGGPDAHPRKTQHHGDKRGVSSSGSAQNSSP